MLSTYKESVNNVAEYSIIHVGIVPSSALYSPTEGNTQDLLSCLMMKHKEVGSFPFPHPTHTFSLTHPPRHECSSSPPLQSHI